MRAGLTFLLARFLFTQVLAAWPLSCLTSWWRPEDRLIGLIFSQGLTVGGKCPRVTASDFIIYTSVGETSSWESLSFSLSQLQISGAGDGISGTGSQSRNLAFRSHPWEHRKQGWEELPRKDCWADNPTSTLYFLALSKTVFSIDPSPSSSFYIIQLLLLSSLPSSHIIQWLSLLLARRLGAWFHRSDIYKLQSTKKRSCERALRQVEAIFQRKRHSFFSPLAENLSCSLPLLSQSSGWPAALQWAQSLSSAVRRHGKCKLLSPLPPVVMWLSDECTSYTGWNYLSFWR